MKTAAERSHRTASRPHPAAGPFFAPVQTKLTVNAPGDRFEREAEANADRVMCAPTRKPGVTERKEEREVRQVQRQGTGVPVVSESVGAGIVREKAGGRSLESGPRHFMESRFDADFSGVRIHDSAESARLSNRLSARAFTSGQHIFFSSGQFSPGTSEGRHLLAHELTHTIQQGAAPQRTPRLNLAPATPAIQRLGLDDALGYFADKANYLVGFRMLTVILGFNPINMAPVDRGTGNVLRALVELLPGGTLITAALERYQVSERAGVWVEAQLGALGDLGGGIRASINAFLNSLSWSDILDLGAVWERAKTIFAATISRLISYAGELATGLLAMAREALLAPLAAMAKDTRGYDLLSALLGRDPLTGEAVPRTPETLIGGFMKLIGREDIWENIQKGNAIERAWVWFQTALDGLMKIVVTIPQQIVTTLSSLTWEDMLSVVEVVKRIAGLYIGVVGQLISWALGTVIELLKILFSVLAPGVMPFLAKAKGAFVSILENPIGFVGNLVRAGRLGFELFAKNILLHLKTALINWIVGPLGEAGVYIPQAFTLSEIVKMVLSVLGLTWQNLRTKLLKIIPEPVLAVLEKTASILVTLATEGPAAAWGQIKAELSELKSMLLAEIMEMVSVQIVQMAVVKVVNLIQPAGAVVEAILAIYNTIMFFVERMSQIVATVAAFVNSIAAIAAGRIADAAKKVESSLAHSLTLVISFLARLIGLGGIPQKVVKIIERLRKPIDVALDKIVMWLGKLLQNAGSAVKSGIQNILAWWRKSAPVRGDTKPHTLTFMGEAAAARLVVRSDPKPPPEFIRAFPVPAEKVVEVQGHQERIDALKAEILIAQGASPPDSSRIEKLDERLTKEFNALGELLSQLMGQTGEEGTEQRPLAIEYPKRRASAYPIIYIGPHAELRVEQQWLREAAGLNNSAAKSSLLAKQPKLATEAGFISWSDSVKPYFPDRRAPLPGGGGEVGLSPEFASLAPGKVIVYAEKFGTGGGSTINNRFYPYGFRAGEERLDGDHVLERQLGGPDAFENLWPLDKHENRSSGATVKSMKVTFSTGEKKTVTVHEARERLQQRRPGQPLFLLVKKVVGG